MNEISPEGPFRMNDAGRSSLAGTSCALGKDSPDGRFSTLNRRDWLRMATAATAVPLTSRMTMAADEPGKRTNVVLVMTDDQGWGDSGYNGHPTLQTPNLDAMARTGVRFERFYSGAPVCSPTRGSCLTGRHPYRYGILGANSGGADAPSKYKLPDEEVTLAEIFRERGYTTGHYGKWHLGDVAGDNSWTPSENGFDDWFSTVRKVATVDPEGYVRNGKPIVGPLKGDDSKIIMDRAEPFIRRAVENDRPFFTVIWFHTPHLPVLATPEYRARYAEHPEFKQHYWGAITAMDAQVGRLRALLQELGVADNTMLWFCSDNGPTRRSGEGPGSPGGLRGWKGTLFEGGVRVPGLLVWPERITEPKTVLAPCSTSDYFPTVLDYLGIPAGTDAPSDGVSLRPFIEGETVERSTPIAFEHHDNLALIEDRYKLLAHLQDGKIEKPALFDLLDDPAESRNVADEYPQVRDAMLAHLERWRASCADSLAGKDYR